MNKFFYGEYGGRFVPETLVPALEEVDAIFEKHKSDKKFKNELNYILKNFVGRETPLYLAERLSKKYNCRVYLKREDLCHTGAHKINNTVGQALLARMVGKKHIIAETGAGQHGVATATIAAHFGLDCTIFMGEEDVKRQAPNVYRMELLGAKVHSVDSGSKTLKDAINEALRYWTLHVNNSFYIFGSVLGPYPFPKIVRHFQSVIGRETKKQINKIEGRDPDYVIACVGGGSNSIGIFSSFIKNPKVKLIGVEAGGMGIKMGEHAARFLNPKKGIFQGTYSYVLQDKGQIQTTHSVSAGLDYPSIGPEHSMLYDQKRVSYDLVSDLEALKGFELLSQKEGIIPALESSHAVAYLEKVKNKIRNKVVIINLSGRGDKDLGSVSSFFKLKGGH